MLLTVSFVTTALNTNTIGILYSWFEYEQENVNWDTGSLLKVLGPYAR